MKRIIKSFVLFGVAVWMLPSCDSYLDVTPTDRRTSEQVYQTESGTNSALNGIYLSLCDNTLYGANLTMTTVEVLAQRYNAGYESRQPFYTISEYKKDENAYKSRFDAIWKKSYELILNINLFIEQVEAREGVVSQAHKNIMLGEAYGMRAFMHFDLLRLYGPLYGIDSTSIAIPYKTKPSASDTAPLLPANQVMDHIMTDLRISQQLLKDDPIITQGILNSPTNDPAVDFYRYRSQRFNYYAAKALEARVLLYRENKPAALAAALSVINAPLVKAGTLFQWTADGFGNDKMLSNEIIFGIYNSRLYENYDAYFAPSLSDLDYLTTINARLYVAFGGTSGDASVAEKDYRFKAWWALAGTKENRTFIKYLKLSPSNSQQAEAYAKMSYFQPLVRISEMYYIAAEATTSSTEAIGYLNIVRPHRGLANLAASANLTTELTNEYVKEFFGEGQLFYFYKRKRTTPIANGSATTGNRTMNVTPGTTPYQIAIPDSEMKIR